MGGVRVDVLRDNGSSGCSVKQSLVRPEQYTGRYIPLIMIDGTTREFPEAIIHVNCPFYTGSVRALAMPEPMYPLIVGNITGVRNGSIVDKSTQTAAAALTRAAAKAAKLSQAPLRVDSPQELMNSEEVAREQQQDPTLACAWKHLQKGNVHESSHGQTRFLLKRGRLYREITTDDDVRLQFVVPEKYRTAVLKLGHSAVLGGHMGQRKTLDCIQAEFYWPGFGEDIKR